MGWQASDRVLRLRAGTGLCGEIAIFVVIDARGGTSRSGNRVAQLLLEQAAFASSQARQ
jgi:hypothetical protein